MESTFQHRKRRAVRVRRQLKKSKTNSFRLTVFRSSKNIYAQVIDDDAGRTLCSASSVTKQLREALSHGGDIAAAKAVGKLLAERAKEANLGPVVFDRGRYLYHGRVKALAEAAREGGMQF